MTISCDIFLHFKIYLGKIYWKYIRIFLFRYFFFPPFFFITIFTIFDTSASNPNVSTAIKYVQVSQHVLSGSHIYTHTREMYLVSLRRLTLTLSTIFISSTRLPWTMRRERWIEIFQFSLLSELTLLTRFNDKFTSMYIETVVKREKRK